MKTILLFSGGLDSTSLLFHLLDQGHELRALGVDYGQRHRKELEIASTIAAMARVRYEVADLRSITHLLASSALTNKDVAVPDGHYTHESMKTTVVPNRNMIMLSVAIGWAISENCETVAYAAHSGDHTIYPDCRGEFIDALARATALSSWHNVEILRPFVQKTKAEIVQVGRGCNAPLYLTWSCYQGGDIHCGRCGTCVERKEAFQLAGVADPTAYQSQPSEVV